AMPVNETVDSDWQSQLTLQMADLQVDLGNMQVALQMYESLQVSISGAEIDLRLGFTKLFLGMGDVGRFLEPYLSQIEAETDAMVEEMEADIDAMERDIEEMEAEMEATYGR